MGHEVNNNRGEKQNWVSPIDVTVAMETNRIKSGLGAREAEMHGFKTRLKYSPKRLNCTDRDNNGINAFEYG